jgi:hypothetical protein
MATGALDTNGVWNYGEDDSIALFSDLLNLGMESTSAAFTTDRARLSTIESNLEVTTTLVSSSATARNARWGTPTTSAAQLTLQNLGARTVRTDLGFTEQYFATYNASSNIGGTLVPGWYPVQGQLPFTALSKSDSQNASGTANAATDITWDLERADRGNSHNTSATTIVANIAGLYRITANVGLNTTTAQLNVTPYINTNALGYLLQSRAASGGNPLVNISGEVILAAGDTVKISFQSSAASVPLISSFCSFSLAYLRPF